MNDQNERFSSTVKLILYLLPGLSLAIIPIFFYDPNLSILGSYLAFPMFLAPIMFIKYKKIHIVSNSSADIFGRSKGYLFLLLIILYLLFFCISIILLQIYDVRPSFYFIIITIMYILIIVEILAFELSYIKKLIILAQNMILAMNIVWGVTLKYYYFIERTDVLAHIWYVINLLNYGHVTDIFDLYQKFPSWHIMIASSYLITNPPFPVHKMAFIINGIVFAIVGIIIYLIALKIFKDAKIALLSSLITATNPEIVWYGMASIPRSMVAFIEFTVILLLLRKDPISKFLVIILTIAMVMYHTASMPFIISIFLLIYLLQNLYNVNYGDRLITGNYLLFTIVVTLTYYIYYANDIFQIIIRNILNPPATGLITKSIVYAPLNELFNYLQFLPVVFFVIIGALWILETKRFAGFEKIFCLTGLLLVAVTVPGPGLLLNKLASNFNLERFALYSFLLIVIVGAIGFTWMYNTGKKSIKIFAIILFILLGFFSISNDFNASDNPLVKRVYYTFYLNQEEVVAFNNIANITEGYVLSDYVTKRYLDFSPYGNRSHFLEVFPTTMSFLRNSSNDVILIRYHELNKRPLRFFVSTDDEFKLNPTVKVSIDYYYQNSLVWNSLEKYNKIYDSGGINGFN